MLISAMKAKQSTDIKYIKSLRNQLNEFKDAYDGLAKEKDDDKKD
jgi:hypothetical protein